MSVLEKMDEIFASADKFSPENMESLVHETLRFFNDLKAKLESKDEEVRNEAQAIANALKAKLEAQAASLCKSVGMEPEALDNYVNNPAHFSSAEWQAMEKAKGELDQYRQEIDKTEAAGMVKRVAKKKPKAVKEWLIG